ncbi:MAG: hypothetical protein ACLFNQ_12495 [Spirochaetaceae bacterium]
MATIAIIGSSGGNLYNLGGDNPARLLKEILLQAQAADITVADVQFIAAGASMDRAKPETQASLWRMGEEGPERSSGGTLSEVNDQAQQVDDEIAARIASGDIDGLVLVSADPAGANKAAIAAAVAKKIPVVGTGGASMAAVRSAGAKVIAASGTTGTTNRTRAVSYIAALAKEWGTRYRPVIGDLQDVSQKPVWKNINLKGIMIASLPAFIAMALMLAISRIPGLEFFADVFDTIIGALPVVIAVIAAKKVSELDEPAIIAGLIAGVLSAEGGILGGIVGGILAGILVTYLLGFSFRYRLPATTANIVSAGFAGIIAGLVVFYGLAPLTELLGEGIRSVIDGAVAFSPVLAGAIAGLVIWPAIIGGFYHAAILPIILLEMEQVGTSFFGAVDMAGLVMVSAGITLANIVAPRRAGERSVAAPGFAINMGFGTFVEAAYPFMFSDKKVFAIALMASTLAGGTAGLLGVRGTAYVPSVVAPFLSNSPVGFASAMLVGLGISFVLTLLVNRVAREA